MIVSSPADFREAARRKLPPFLFHYLDGGSYSEQTLRRNVEDWEALAIRQRVLSGVGEIDLTTTLFDEPLKMPVVLAPVGLAGMYAKRGEVQAARAAGSRGVPFTLSTVSVCAIEEVATATDRPMWFQLYVLRDRGFMKQALERAKAVGVKTLVFTVDMPVPGARYRDARSGMSGAYASWRRIIQAASHPAWAWDVGLHGAPHDLGNVSHYLGKATGLADYIGWLGENFDPSISWKDLQWIRDMWEGPMVIKGILDVEDARDAVSFGADGVIVSNHGGRQLDGVVSSARALPEIAAAVGGDVTVMVDSGVRSGLDVMRAIALGAKAVMIGRSYIYALAAQGGIGVGKLLDLFEREMRVGMALAGVNTVGQLGPGTLAKVHISPR
jgi:L-lactate dehydrogenase (cytochrome)